jgi:hypothetical protein
MALRETDESRGVRFAIALGLIVVLAAGVSQSPVVGAARGSTGKRAANEIRESAWPDC